MNTGHKEIYVLIYFPLDGKACCLDRGYNVLYGGEDRPDIWGRVTVGSIVQTDQLIYEQCPQWAIDLVDHNHPYITMWTRYYD